MVYPALLPLMRTPRLPVVDWTDAPRRFKWTRPFCRKAKSGFCECSITIQTQSIICSFLSTSSVTPSPCQARAFLSRGSRKYWNFWYENETKNDSNRVYSLSASKRKVFVFQSRWVTKLWTRYWTKTSNISAKSCCSYRPGLRTKKRILCIRNLWSFILTVVQSSPNKTHTSW